MATALSEAVKRDFQVPTGSRHVTFKDCSGFRFAGRHHFGHAFLLAPSSAGPPMPRHYLGIFHSSQSNHMSTATALPFSFYDWYRQSCQYC